MSWQDVYNLLRRTGGRIEMIGAEELKAATAKGPGDRETQIRIARAYYDNQTNQIRKEAKDGQTNWQFG
jgi:hypothetical protein